MKRLLLFILIALSAQGCIGQQPFFEDVEPQKPNVQILVMNVKEIQNDVAWIYTKSFEVRYEVEAEGLEIGKEYLFKISIHPCDSCRSRKADIHWFTKTPEQAKKDARELVKKSTTHL